MFHFIVLSGVGVSDGDSWGELFYMGEGGKVYSTQ